MDSENVIVEPVVRCVRGRVWPRVVQERGDGVLTRQEFARDCDVNVILAQFQKTGAMSHFAKYAPEFGDFSSYDYHEAQNLVLRARQMFDELPAAVRNLCASPAGFLDFVQDPANAEKMRELGLCAASPAEPAKPAKVAGKAAADAGEDSPGSSPGAA